MRIAMLRTIVALALLTPLAAHAAPATIYFDTGGCQSGSTTLCSGTTDSASAIVSGTGATITCSATSGPSSAPGCSISGSPDLSGVATDGSQAIFLNCASNVAQKIFFINAIDDTSDLVGTTVTPTGCTASTSDWGIGGRMIYDSAKFEGAVVAGTTLIFNNTPATKTTTFLTARAAGNSTGTINVRGANCASRPVLETTNASIVINASSQLLWRVSCLELKAGGNTVVNATGGSWTFDQIKVSQGGSIGINITVAGVTVINSEVTGTTDVAIKSSADTNLFGNYVHGGTTDCIQLTNANPSSAILSNIISGCGGKGINISGASTTSAYRTSITGNTIYNTTGSGLFVADADVVVTLRNNIFQSNGTSSAYNVEWSAGNAQAVSVHNCNVFYQASGTAAGNLLNLTTNSTEFTTDPLLTNPGAADFTISSASSPAANAACPSSYVGTTGTNFGDIGAMQRAHGTGGGFIIGGG